jgi:hypothetical protein
MSVLGLGTVTKTLTHIQNTGMIQALLKRGSYNDLFIETGSTQDAQRLVDQVKHARSRDEVDSIVNAVGDPCTVALAVKLHFKHLAEPAFPFRFFPEVSIHIVLMI